MTLEQTTFMGASISSFSADIGWNEQQSQLTALLVEDPSNSDAFLNPSAGTVATFQYGSFTFGGIVQSQKTKRSLSGNPIYEITLIDPRDILAGTQVILSGYTGSTFGVPNLINVYGYYESQGFGRSSINDAGMPWSVIRQGISDLTAFTFGSNIHGGNIRFLGQNFVVDLSELPTMPSTYRINGDQISLLDLIGQVCNDASYNYYVILQEGSLVHSIKVKTVARKIQPNLTAINSFLLANPEAVSKDRGLELRTEDTSVFLTGGNITSLQPINQTENPNVVQQVNIWPFWGFDEGGNANFGTRQLSTFTSPDTILLTDFPDDEQLIEPLAIGHTTYIDVSPFFNSFSNGGLPDLSGALTSTYGTYLYPMSVGELRAALKGQAEWETYVSAKTSPAVKEALGLNPLFSIEKLIQINDNLEALEADLQQNGKIDNLALLGDLIFQLQTLADKSTTEHFTNTAYFYQYILLYAQEFYGKQFMIKMPFDIETVRQPDTLNYVNNYDVIDAGYLLENSTPLGLPTHVQDQFTTDEGLYLPLARFDSASGLNVSELNPQDYYFVNDSSVLYVRCDVEPDWIYQDWTNTIGGRAVIRLPGRVYKTNQEGEVGGLVGLYIHVTNLDLQKRGQPPLTDAEKNRLKFLLQKAIYTPGSTNNLGLFGAYAAMPDYVAVPVRSNIDHYGPWYVMGAEGKIRYEQDDSLVPWNYGGFDGLNSAAQSRATEAVSNMISDELGNIEIVGAPGLSVGSALTAGGPIVTNISCRVDTGGVTTNYIMRSYSPQFGSINRINADRFSKLNNIAFKQRREIKKLQRQFTPGFKYKIGGAKTNAERSFFDDLRNRPDVINKSPHNVIFTDAFFDIATNKYVSSVALDTAYNATSYVKDGLANTSGIVTGLDMLFSPYLLNTDDGFPNNTFEYTEPYILGASQTQFSRVVNDTITESLNTEVQVALGASTFEYDDAYIGGELVPKFFPLLYDGFSNPVGGQASWWIQQETFGGLLDTPRSRYEVGRQGGLAFKTPIMVAGVGRDIYGRPIPSGFNNLDSVDPSRFKVGPLDIRWNDETGTWQAVSPQYPGAMKGTIVQTEGEIKVRLFNDAVNNSTSYQAPEFPLFANNVLNPMEFPLYDGLEVLITHAGSYPTETFYIISAKLQSFVIVDDIQCVNGVTTIVKQLIAAHNAADVLFRPDTPAESVAKAAAGFEVNDPLEVIT